MKNRAVFLLTTVLTCLFLCLSVFADYSRDVVMQVQQALNEEGFDCGTPDGAAGKKTKKAIKKYQKREKLEVTGKIDDELLESLGIPIPSEEGSAGDEADRAEGLPALEGFSESLYSGNWVSVANRFEVYLPEQLAAGPIYNFVEADMRKASYLYGRMEENGKGTGILAGSVKEQLGESPLSGTKVTDQEIADYENRLTSELGAQKVQINGIPGYYYERVDFGGRGRICFCALDPEYDLVLSVFDINDGAYYSETWREQGYEYARNILLSLRMNENSSEDEETVSVPTELPTGNAADEAAEPTGTDDGTASDGHAFAWSADKVLIFLTEGEQAYMLLPRNGALCFERLDPGQDSVSYSVKLSPEEDIPEIEESMWLLFGQYMDSLAAEFEKDAAYPTVAEEAAAELTVKIMKDTMALPPVEKENWAQYDADGTFDGSTTNGYKFKWFLNRSWLYLDGSKLYRIQPLPTGIVLGRLAEDGQTYLWQKTMWTSAEELAEMGSCMYTLFIEKRNFYDSVYGL